MGTPANELYRKVFLEEALLTPAEEKIVREQIRKNTCVIGDYVNRLDLIVNREGHRQHEVFVDRIRERLYLLMSENDTFREVYWRHCVLEEARHPHTNCPLCVS